LSKKSAYDFFTTEGNTMKRILILASLIVSSQAFATEYLVKYTSNSAFSALSTLSANREIKVLDNHTVGRLVTVDINPQNEAHSLAKLLSNPAIQYVVPNFKLHTFAAPLDPTALKSQWAIAKVQVEKAWELAGNRGNKSVVVAVIDTGVDYNHESLSKNMVQGFDFAENDNDPMDKTSAQNPGHGTHCAGVIGATGLAQDGTIGISPEVSLMPLRFLNESGSGDLDNAVKAIDYAIEHGAQVISASWGAAVPRSQAAPLLEAIKRADDKGIIFVAAAANDGKNNDNVEMYPANNGYPNSITVAASGPNDEKPSWSNFGTAKVHVASPGLNIMSSLPGNKYGELSGTSMATPLVAGLVALLKAQDAGLSGAQIRAILQTSGAQVSIQTACNCRVDAFNAVDAVKAKKMTMVPAAATLATGESVTMQVLYGQAPFKFVSSDPAIATVSDAGVVAAVANGATRISATDAAGKSASTLDIHVGAAGKDPGNPDEPGNPGECPVGNPQLCEILCKIQPTLPFCKQ
jgi:thermitase